MKKKQRYVKPKIKKNKTFFFRSARVINQEDLFMAGVCSIPHGYCY